MVPIVEPEVLMDGDHSLDRCFEVTELVINTVFDALFEQHVVLEQMLLKPNMVIPGLKCPAQASVMEVADATIQCLRRTVPAAVPGIVFLSGGQDEDAATKHLNALNLRKNLPWELSFSYGRALQNSALQAWRGEPANVKAARDIFYERAKLNSAARFGNL
jgi:fructose-bisphosphate aldolase class I